MQEKFDKLLTQCNNAVLNDVNELIGKVNKAAIKEQLKQLLLAILKNKRFFAFSFCFILTNNGLFGL